MGLVPLFLALYLWHGMDLQLGMERVYALVSGMVVSGMCVLLVWYLSSFKNNQAAKTAAAGKITLGRCLRRD